MNNIHLFSIFHHTQSFFVRKFIYEIDTKRNRKEAIKITVFEKRMLLTTDNQQITNTVIGPMKLILLYYFRNHFVFSGLTSTIV